MRRETVVGVLILLTAIIAGLLLTQVAGRVAALRAAPQDNVQWALAQLDVELMAFDLAVHEADDAKPEHLAELRKRFDIFYSRVSTTGSMPLFRDGATDKATSQDIATIKRVIESITPYIDGSDSNLVAHSKEILSDLEQLRSLSRQISLTGVKLYAAQSDASRSDFAHLLAQTALVNGLLFLALVSTMLFLFRQMRISKRRAVDLEASSNRNASTVNASLDAIIAIDMTGEIVDFNPAACQIFGYSRNVAMGRKLEELIIPEKDRARHLAGFEHFRKTMESDLVGAGRVEMFALRADGTEFPIEMSLGTTQSSNGQLVIAFLRDISSRVDQERDLRKARDEAVEAARVKSQFLAVMSHEMRTPLNGVMAVLDLLQSTTLTKKQKTYVETATTSADILKQHVDDVLDLTRIQAGKLEFYPRVFNLVELLEEVQNINVATANKRGNRIILNIDMAQPYFVADRKRIHQVLTNLIGNAIKFTNDGVININAKFVNVRADIVTVEFRVTDSGIGIAKHQQGFIFEDFVTLDASYQRSAEGAGLGLPICRSIVEAMDGVIGVDSELGQGASFWFRIPLKAAFEASEAITIPVALEKKSKGGKLLKVLVVDDNETNRFVVEEMLRSAHCSVVLAKDGIGGVAAAEKQRFDLILMDLSMPRMNGWDAAREIRQSSASISRHVPIIALTAHALPEEQGALIKAGMQGCILKPLRSLELNQVLAKIRDGIHLGTTEAPATALSPNIIDQRIIDELREILDPKTFIDRISKFIVELETVPQTLFALSKARNKKNLIGEVHRFAGSAAVFGAKDLRTCLVKLETTAPKLKRIQILQELEAVEHQAKNSLAYFVKLRREVESVG